MSSEEYGKRGGGRIEEHSMRKRKRRKMHMRVRGRESDR